MRTSILLILLAGFSAAVCAETADRSKALTHPLNVVGHAEPARHVAGSAEHSKALTEPVNVVGPAEQQPPAGGNVDVRLSQEGGTQSAALTVGQKLTVAIAGNPSTGYQWELSEPVAGAVLEQEGSPIFVAAAGNLVGAPGEYRFVFKAVGEGTTTIGLKYVRPWEQEAAPAATATVHVTVSR